MMRTPKAFISVVVMSLVAVAVIATPSLGQSISSIFDQLDQQKGSKQAMETEIGSLQGDTAAKQKQVNFWEQYTRNELKAQAAPIQKRIDAYNADVQRGEAARHAYNARCAGVRLSRAGKARCDGEYDQLLAWKERLGATERRLEQDKRALRKRGADIHKKVQQLTSVINNNQGRMNNLRTQLKNVKRTIQQLEEKVRRMCETESNTCEIIHHCASMNWDGARPNLPLAAVTRCK